MKFFVFSILIFSFGSFAKSKKITTNFTGDFLSNLPDIEKLRARCDTMPIKGKHRATLTYNGKKIRYCDPAFGKSLQASLDITDPAFSELTMLEFYLAEPTTVGKSSSKDKGTVRFGKNAAKKTTTDK